MATTKAWKQASMLHDTKHNVIYIDAHEKDFVPKYLDYLLEYHNIPKDVKRVFTKDRSEK